MQRRYLYVLMFGVPALLAAAIIAVALFGALVGVLWLFVFGDNAWPATADTLLAVLLVLACLVLWTVLLAVAYRVGRQQEARAALEARHVFLAVGATAVLVLLVGLHQWGVGNLGPPNPGVVCAEYCRAQGFAGSELPPRNSGVETCSCLDGQGQVASTLPLAILTAPPRP